MRQEVALYGVSWSLANDVTCGNGNLGMRNLYVVCDIIVSWVLRQDVFVCDAVDLSRQAVKDRVLVFLRAPLLQCGFWNGVGQCDAAYCCCYKQAGEPSHVFIGYACKETDAVHNQEDNTCR